MRKKILAMSLALVMVIGVGKGIVASAENVTVTSNNGTTWTDSANMTKQVKISTVTAGTVYSVDISWGNLTITEAASTWKPDSHTYAGSDASFGDTGTITVTNHSNAAVKSTCGFAYTDSTESNMFKNNTYPNSNLAVSVDTTPKSMSSAAEVAYGAPGSAANVTHTLSVSGKLNSTTQVDGLEVGNASITLSN